MFARILHSGITREIRMKSLYAIVTLILMYVVPNALAHGVEHNFSQGATAITAAYDDGSPMAYCDVKVFTPGEGKEPYQEGSSDRNGCFAFLPDTNGIWRVTVDDGMGHLLDAGIEISSTGLLSESESPQHKDRLKGTVLGVSLIFGCFGLYAMFTGGKRKKREL